MGTDGKKQMITDITDDICANLVSSPAKRDPARFLNFGAG